MVLAHYTLLSAIWLAPAYAMNWEGHDAWFHDTAPFRAFYDGIPGPLVKPKPSCAQVRERHLANPYEQTALPGRNCVENTEPPPARPRS
jgi:hypothetical protein